MGVFKYFPYTNFHELNLNWIMEKVEQAYDLSIINKDELEKIKSVISDPLTDEQKQQVFEYLLEIMAERGAELVIKSDLTSNDIDAEAISDYFMDDGSNTGLNDYARYSIAESMSILDNGEMYVAFVDERTGHNKPKNTTYYTNSVKIRKYGSIVSGSDYETVIPAGHANGMATNGTDRLYIGWLKEVSNGAFIASKRLTVVYLDNNKEVASYAIKPLVHVADGVAYDFDNDHVLVRFINGIDIYDADMNFIETIPVNYVQAFSDDARQDALYYDGMLGAISGYSNILAFYDLKTGDLVKMYNIPRRTSSGSPFVEMESGQYYKGNFYLMSFNRLGDSTQNHWNFIRLNPWKNVFTGYHFKNRYTGSEAIYCDPGDVNNTQWGTEQQPFTNLNLAIAAMQARSADNVPSYVMLRAGTESRGIKIQDVDDVRIARWNKTDTQDSQLGDPIIKGAYLSRCYDFIIQNINFQKNNYYDSGTGRSTVYITRCTGTLDSCTIEGDNENGSIGVYATNQSEINAITNTITNTCRIGYRFTERPTLKLSGGMNLATLNTVSLLTYSVVKDRMKNVPSSYSVEQIAEPLTKVLQPISQTNFYTGDYAFDQPVVNNFMIGTANTSFNYLEIVTYYDQKTDVHRVRLNESSAVTSFQVGGFRMRGSSIDVPTYYTITGSVDLSNKTLSISDITLYLPNATNKVLHYPATGSQYPAINRVHLL